MYGGPTDPDIVPSACPVSHCIQEGEIGMSRDLLESSEMELWSGQGEPWWAGLKSSNECLGNPVSFVTDLPVVLRGGVSHSRERRGPERTRLGP